MTTFFYCSGGEWLQDHPLSEPAEPGRSHRSPLSSTRGSTTQSPSGRAIPWRCSSRWGTARARRLPRGQWVGVRARRDHGGPRRAVGRPACPRPGRGPRASPSLSCRPGPLGAAHRLPRADPRGARSRSRSGGAGSAIAPARPEWRRPRRPRGGLRDDRLRSLPPPSRGRRRGLAAPPPARWGGTALPAGGPAAVVFLGATGLDLRPVFRGLPALVRPPWERLELVGAEWLAFATGTRAYVGGHGFVELVPSLSLGAGVVAALLAVAGGLAVAATQRQRPTGLGPPRRARRLVRRLVTDPWTGRNGTPGASSRPCSGATRSCSCCRWRGPPASAAGSGERERRACSPSCSSLRRSR